MRNHKINGARVPQLGVVGASILAAQAAPSPDLRRPESLRDALARRNSPEAWLAFQTPTTDRP